MSLNISKPGCFNLTGSVTFDNSALVAESGKVVLSQHLKNNKSRNWEINLNNMKIGDSSSLSVFLTWIRFSQSNNLSLFFSNIPPQLEALAKVSDIYDFLVETTN